jgi:hypothetical protein
MVRSTLTSQRSKEARVPGVWATISEILSAVASVNLTTRALHALLLIDWLARDHTWLSREAELEQRRLLCMDTSSQRVAAAFSRMQERDGLRSRASVRSQLVRSGSRLARPLWPKQHRE